METTKQAQKSRVGAKKKNSEDKSQPVQFYITGKQIENVGGIDKAREIAKAAIIYSGLVKK